MPELEQPTTFNRDAIAKHYATVHKETDPGVVSIHYLPKNADEREIRLLEVNNMIGDITDAPLVPIDFGMDIGTNNAHQLLIVDVTPDQWERIKTKELALPDGWVLDNEICYEDE